MQPLVPRQRFTDLSQLPLSLRMGSFQSEILGWGFFEPRWWRNYLHSHSFFEICYAFAGEGLFRIGEQEHSVRQGQVFVARPGETHEIISATHNPLGIYFWSYTLTQRQDCPLQAIGSDALLHAFLTSNCSVSAQTPGMQRTLELLTEEIVQRAAGYRQVIEGLVVKLLFDTARAVVVLPEQALDPMGRSQEEAIVRVMVHYLRDNACRVVSIRDLAAQIHLSERHTSRLFQKVMGTSIKTYLSTIRMETAAQLLLEQRLSIKEIAQATGYPNVRYFITVFHQKTGLTPAVFRQKGGTRFLHLEK